MLLINSRLGDNVPLDVHLVSQIASYEVVVLIPLMGFSVELHAMIIIRFRIGARIEES